MGGIFDPKNQTSTTQVNLPQYITSAYQNALGRVQSASDALPNYTGELSAPTSPLEAAAYAGLPGAVNAAQPYIDRAAGLTDTGTTPTTVMPYTQTALGQYMNPYTQSVIDATQKQFNLGNAQQQAQLKGSAASNHALGGDRAAVAAAQLAGQQQTAQAPIIAGLNQANFTQAQNEFNTQQQTDLSNKQANAYRALYGAGEYGNLGQLAQGTQLAGLGAELTAGAQQQQTQQNADTAAMQDYYLKLGYPLQTAQTFAQTAASLGSVYGGDRTTTTPGPSLFGQIAGAGLGLAGLGAFGPVSGLFGGVNGLGLGANVANSIAANPYLFAEGGEVPAVGYADGGEFDDEDEPSYSENPDEEVAQNSLAAIAAPQRIAGLSAAGPSAYAPEPGLTAGGGGLDPTHRALLAAGLGMMSAKGDALSGIGQGGLAGLKEYATAQNQERQLETLREQTAYRQAMSTAATKRAEALAQHYENADNKPVLIHGKTFQWYYPSDGTYHDTHIDNPAYLTGQANVDVRNRELNRPDYVFGGTDMSDPAHPKGVYIDRHNPANRTVVDAAPGKGGPNGAGGVFGFKYQKAKESGMSDKDALDFASGHKKVDEKTIGAWAMRDATAQANAQNSAGSFESPEQYNTFRQQAYENNLRILKAPSVPQAPASAPVPPKPGEVRGGYKFKGGDPSKKENWEKV